MERRRGRRLRHASDLISHIRGTRAFITPSASPADVLEEASVENVIALRGDPPRGETEFVAVEGGLRHASDLISHIRGNYAFGIAAACYPEGHTEAVDLDADLEYAG